MFAIPYHFSRASLYTPCEAEDFFQYGSAQIQTEAALCAEMSRLAYVKEVEPLEKHLAHANFQLVKAIGYSNKGTQLFIAYIQEKSANKPLVVIAFRGTESDDPTDLMTDARLLKKLWMNKQGESLGRVHGGFADALTDNVNILEQLQRELGNFNPCRILLTGHSLGAALATLTASYLLHTDVGQDMQLYTFGSPRVGDKDFAYNMLAVAHIRYVNCCDLVTRLPPKELGYVHVGALRYIDRNGHIIQSVDNGFIEQDRFHASVNYLKKYSFLKGAVSVRELADHTPINYVSGVTSLRP
jgi:hypothetical protein